MNLKFLSSLILLLISFITLADVKWPKIESAVKKDINIEKRVQNILANMSLEEKIGQMVQPEIKHSSPEDATRYNLGSILNGGGSYPSQNKYSKITDWLKLADDYYYASIKDSKKRSAIPILWGTDAVHGHSNVYGATIFPHNIGLGAANDPFLMRKIARVTSIEMLATGINWVFAPTVAVVRDDRWGRTYEGYSEDPAIVRSLAGAVVEGLQGKDETLFTPGRVISTLKHFVGDGGTTKGTDQGDTQVSEQELLDIHAQGYLSGLAAGAQIVMASYNSWNGKKVHGHKYLLTEVLKNKMGFDGFVIGDWNGHGQVEGCSNDSCPQAINAGVDMIMVPEDWKNFINNTVSQVKSGEISIDRINDAVTRILRVKLRANLYEIGAPSKRKYAGKTELVGSAHHRSVAREAVRKSLVLLKNKNQILPLSAKQRILVAGPAADNIPFQTGGWTLSWQGDGNTNSDFPGATSIYDAIEETVKNSGGSVELSHNGHYSQRPDVAVVVFGEAPYAEMFGDIEDLFFASRNSQGLDLVRKYKREGIPVVSLFITGRPLWVNQELNASDAFVVAWLPGTEGNGITDVIFRKDSFEINYDFTGKLSFSWPMHAAQYSLNKGAPSYAPLFPIGYGLTYDDEDNLSDYLPEIAFPK